nr:MGMT family protein [Phocaeicola sartorii]
MKAIPYGNVSTYGEIDISPTSATW